MSIDLRSDTVTRPTHAMLEAMMRAPVGDDVYGEDPTVNALQEHVAALFGKEAALFTPTGVLANQIAIKAWTVPGDEVLVEREAHIFQYETGAPAMMSAVQLHPLPSTLGVLEPAQVLAAVRPSDYYYPRTALLCIENTHNRWGGTLYPIEQLRALAAVCRDAALPLHLDGARIWNAHVASGTPLHEYGTLVDSIAVCFSKGLGAPVGSMLLGSRELITRAHKFRKIFGGGMRQAGVLAAAAMHALGEHLPLLAVDHARARRFAAALQGCGRVRVDMARVQSNMVLLEFPEGGTDAGVALERLARRGVLIGRGMGNALRAVFHLDLTDAQVDEACAICQEEFA